LYKSAGIYNLFPPKEDIAKRFINLLSLEDCMETKILEDIGFTQGEIKVYFALLELGESTIGPISKKSCVTPAKTYPILEKLKGKGLITSIIKSGTNFFQLLNPNRILNFLDEKEKRIGEQKEEIKKILPQLSTLQKTEAEQFATIYETFNGIKTLYGEILEYLNKNKEDFIGFTLGGEYQGKQANLFFKNYDAKRKSLGIKTKLLGLESQRDYLEKNYHKNKNIEIKYISHSLPTGVIIFDNKVATLLWNEKPIAFVIHSKQNAESYRNFFKDLKA
jgi:sugar-specific transcriptional regulator TrmB